MMNWWAVAAGAACMSMAMIEDCNKQNDDAWASLVSAERAFSEESVKRGVAASFLASFAPDALTFPPGKPIQVGTEHLRDAPPQSGELRWWPVKAEVSDSGDFGYTTGPWEFRRQPSDTAPAATGCYTSVWARSAGGSWKVLADFGYTGPHPADVRSEPVRPSPRKPKPGASAATLEDLLAEDRRFGAAAASEPAKGYGLYLAADARYYRDGMKPALGRDAALAVVRSLDASVTWKPARSAVAKSSDIGFTVGTMEVTRKQAGISRTEYLKYMRVWRNENGKWKVALEVANAGPAPGS